MAPQNQHFHHTITELAYVYIFTWCNESVSYAFLLLDQQYDKETFGLLQLYRNSKIAIQMFTLTYHHKTVYFFVSMVPSTVTIIIFGGRPIKIRGMGKGRDNARPGSEK